MIEYSRELIKNNVQVVLENIGEGGCWIQYIDRVDLEEWKSYWKKLLPSTLNILDVSGFYKYGGSFIADKEWRINQHENI